MKLTIDNLQGAGAVDYTSALDGTVAPRVLRKINQPSELRCGLLGGAVGIRVTGGGVAGDSDKGGWEFLFHWLSDTGAAG